MGFLLKGQPHVETRARTGWLQDVRCAGYTLGFVKKQKCFIVKLWLHVKTRAGTVQPQDVECAGYMLEFVKKTGMFCC